jgi:hypothetical protein
MNKAGNSVWSLLFSRLFAALNVRASRACHSLFEVTDNALSTLRSRPLSYHHAPYRKAVRDSALGPVDWPDMLLQSLESSLGNFIALVIRSTEIEPSDLIAAFQFTLTGIFPLRKSDRTRPIETP